MITNIRLSKWHWIFIGIVVVILIVSAILRTFTPPEFIVPDSPFTTVNSEGTTTQFRNISFTGSLLQPPEELRVMQVTNISQNNLQEELIATFNLTPHPQAPNIWRNDDFSLSYHPKTNNYYLYFQKPGLQTEQLPPLDPDQAIVTAQDFVNRYFPGHNFQPLTSEIEFFLGVPGSEYAASVAGQANVMVIPFSYQVDRYPIFYEYQVQHPIRITVKSGGTIAQAEVSDQQLNFQELSNVSSISVDKAVQNLTTTNQGVVILAAATEVQDMSLDTLDSAKLSSVQLEYRFDPNLNLLYPFYRFSGEATNDQGSTMSVQIITPAVETLLR